MLVYFVIKIPINILVTICPLFSAYYISPEVYYLQNVFYSKDEYQSFLNTISSRNALAIDNSVSVNDRIITLSTCHDGSSGRSVVHARLVSVY